MKLSSPLNRVAYFNNILIYNNFNFVYRLSIAVQRFNVPTANRTSSLQLSYLFLNFVFSHEIFTPKGKKIILILKSDLEVIDQ